MKSLLYTILFSVLFFICSPLYAQEDSLNISSDTITADSDTVSYVRLPKLQFEQLRSDIQVLLREDSLNTELISSLKNENRSLRNLVQEDSMLLNIRNERIQVQDELMTVYEDRIDQLTNGSFWNSKEFGFIIGVISVYITSEIIENVNNSSGN